jgi:DUF1016 N-terminal domain/TaqI-like C-terminal specificity domain
MTKKTSNLSTRSVAKRGSGYAKLVKAIGQVNTGLVTRAAVAVNQALVLRNWLIGAYIVEFEQNGSDRAKYGARLLPTLAKDLKAKAIKGLGAEVLRTCRLFFLSYPGISQTLSGKLELSPEHASISQTVSGKLGEDEAKHLCLNRIESAFIKPWYKNSDIDRWVTAKETAKRLIYIRADSEFDENNIPNLLIHFEKFKPQLVNRNVRTGSITVKQYDDFVRGRGDVPYVMIKSAFSAGKFYCVSYARDAHVFAGEKIVCPQFSPLNTFAFDNREWFAASDVYFIKKKRGSEFDLKYLLGILNSKLCYFWLYHKGQRKGDLLQLFKGPLSEIPISKPGNQAGEVVTLVDRILTAKLRGAGADTSELEQLIDTKVFDLYGLSEAERALVMAPANQFSTYRS